MMNRKIITNNPKLKPFFDEINKYKEGIHNLNDGVSDFQINNIEKSFNISLPNIYKDFLKLVNGGELFAIPSGTTISQIYDPSKGTKQEGISYLDESMNPQRRWPLMPEDYLIIADKNDGDTICIDLNTSDSQDASIVQWSHETGLVSMRWGNLIDWLMDELEIGAMLVDYDGNEI